MREKGSTVTIVTHDLLPYLDQPNRWSATDAAYKAAATLKDVK